MAFNKVTVVLTLLISAVIVDARVYQLVEPSNVSALSASDGKLAASDCCNNCSEIGESSVCNDFKIGFCGDGCKICICLRTYPPVCSCRDAIDACPSKCDSEFNFATLLGVKAH